MSVSPAALLIKWSQSLVTDLSLRGKVIEQSTMSVVCWALSLERNQTFEEIFVIISKLPQKILLFVISMGVDLANIQKQN